MLKFISINGHEKNKYSVNVFQMCVFIRVCVCAHAHTCITLHVCVCVCTHTWVGVGVILPVVAYIPQNVPSVLAKIICKCANTCCKTHIMAVYFRLCASSPTSNLVDPSSHDPFLRDTMFIHKTVQMGPTYPPPPRKLPQISLQPPK